MPPTEREIGRYTFKSKSFGHALYLCYPEPGRQCGLAAKRRYQPPSGLALDIVGERVKRIEHLPAHYAGPTEIGAPSDVISPFDSRTIG